MKRFPPGNDSENKVSLINSALVKLERWIEREQFRGWDPHDALNSPFLRGCGRANRLFGIAALQFFKRSPINLRRLFRVQKDFNPKGMGLFLSSYARRYKTTGDPRYRDQVRYFAEWLRSHASPGYAWPCWGYNFDWPNRAFFAPAGTPTIVNTAFIGLAFLDAHGFCSDGDDSNLRIARSVCDFILHGLNRREEADEFCFSYTPLDHRFVHNANMLGAWLLARVHEQTGEPILKQTAMSAARYTARRQRADGSWPYGDATNDSWIDNFHTAFVLSAFHALSRALNTTEFCDVMDRGYAYWKNRMFTPEGAPRYYSHRTFPIDIHAVAQATLTFLDYSDRDPDALERAISSAEWGIRNMQDSDGFFHYQIHRRYRIGIPYMRWAQAWMYRALCEVELRCL